MPRPNLSRKQFLDKFNLALPQAPLAIFRAQSCLTARHVYRRLNRLRVAVAICRFDRTRGMLRTRGVLDVINLAVSHGPLEKDAHLVERVPEHADFIVKIRDRLHQFGVGRFGHHDGIGNYSSSSPSFASLL